MLVSEVGEAERSPDPYLHFQFLIRAAGVCLGSGVCFGLALTGKSTHLNRYATLC